MPDATASLLETADSDAAAGAAAGEGCASPGRQLQILDRLAEAGLEIALTIERRVKHAPPDQPLAELNAAAMAFARVARAVRQTLMLRSRLQAETNAAAAKAGDLRSRVGRIVRRAIEDEHGEKERAEGLAAEACERLEQERYGDILIRPVGEIVADICRDLGLSPDWDRLDDDIRAAEAFARGVAGDAAADPDEDGDIELLWMGEDGRLQPAAKMFPNHHTPFKDRAPPSDSG